MRRNLREYSEELFIQYKYKDESQDFINYKLFQLNLYQKKIKKVKSFEEYNILITNIKGITFEDYLQNHKARCDYNRRYYEQHKETILERNKKNIERLKEKRNSKNE